jgi:uncharacterized integral membrane protein
MGRLQRFFLNLISSIALALLLVTVISNWETSVTVQFLEITLADLSLGSVFLGIIALTGLIGILKSWELMGLVQKNMRKSERHLEKAEVTAEISTDKVKALESKVQTLEKALSKALEDMAKSRERG